MDRSKLTSSAIYISRAHTANDYRGKDSPGPGKYDDNDEKFAPKAPAYTMASKEKDLYNEISPMPKKGNYNSCYSHFNS